MENIDNLFIESLTKKEIGKQINQNVRSGNDHFDILFQWSKSLEKVIKGLKPKFKEMQIISNYIKEGDKLILSIDFANSPVIKLLRDVYGVKTN